MEILLWLVPAALVTLLASWVAAVAARREEARRLEDEDRDGSADRQHEAPGSRREAGAPSQVPGWDELDDGVSEPRPARRPVDPAPRPAAARDDHDERPGHGGSVRRSA